MNSPTIHASPNAAPTRYGRLKIWTLPVAAALFLALTDAFELNRLPFDRRLAYWLVLLCLGQGTNIFLRARLGELPASGTRLAAMAPIVCFASAVPMSIVVWAFTGFALSEPLRAGRLADFYVAVLIVTAAMFALNLLVRHRSGLATASPLKIPATPAVAPIRARLPDKLKTSALYALEAEDHYVRVHTSAGSDLVLMRFADAINEMGGIEGAQVHRSWWVARNAVETSGAVDDRRILVLSGGIEVPVSRALAKQLRESGWFS